MKLNKLGCLGLLKMDKTITLELTTDQVNAILQTLGQLPTSSGAFPLMVEIKKQAENQMAEKV